MAYIRRMTVLFVMLFVFLALPVRAEAGSAVIQFTTPVSEIQKGDIFTVVCQVTSTDSFLDTEFQIEYDAELVQFIKGGRKVTGGDGLLTVASTGNETAVSKRTFSLQFVANKRGNAVFDVKGTASVKDEEGSEFAISSNRLILTVKKKGAGSDSAPGTPAQPVVTPEPVLSANNKLRSLKTDTLSFTPDFTADTEKYTARVAHNMDALYISFQAEDDKARVQLKGNEKLKDGTNEVQVIVTAENGKARKYQISVTRETAKETKEREDQENQTDQDISFVVRRDKDRILLKNSYEFEVLDPSGLAEIPAGYILSRIEIGGIQVPAFTMENNLEGNYLLMYLKGPTGTSGIYQYDRTEKTLQRYTGNMIDKVNKSAGTDKEKGGLTLSNYILLGVIVGLVILLLCMLITMLKMAMKKKEGEAARRHVSQRDEGYDEERFYR